MEFRTLVSLPKEELKINHPSRLMLLGSCFAENIGNLLLENKFSCEINPFGILYNPFSIANALDELIEGKLYKENDLFHYQGNWHSYMHHSSFSSPSREECLSRINGRISKAAKYLKQTDLLLLTFGTAFVYFLKETGQAAGNCHKLPDSCFDRRLTGVDKITERFSSCIFKLLVLRPDLKLLLTVSPIRHIKDGMHGNQLSKSTLLLAINRLQQLFPENVFYFPSFEIMTDELRDYRFYADDMLHPSSLAIDYIWECFVNSYFPKETQLVIKEWKKIAKELNHKPFDSDSDKYKSFLMQTVLKIERLKEKYPYLDVVKELDLCHILLKQ